MLCQLIYNWGDTIYVYSCISVCLLTKVSWHWESLNINQIYSTIPSNVFYWYLQFPIWKTHTFTFWNHLEVIPMRNLYTKEYITKLDWILHTRFYITPPILCLILYFGVLFYKGGGFLPCCKNGLLYWYSSDTFNFFNTLFKSWWLWKIIYLHSVV